MEIRYNLSGESRKRFVKAIGEILQTKTKYLGMPTAAYQIDRFTVTKDGTLMFDDRADSKEIKNLLERLDSLGFAAEKSECFEEKMNGLTVEIPLENVAMGNLTNLLDAKGSLIKKALGIKELPIELSESTVSFPWFDEVDSELAKTYTHFISALCEMSKSLKTISARAKPVENEKYAFRCFLIRLGFIGKQYKGERKILLKNLTGSSAFKSPKQGS